MSTTTIKYFAFAHLPAHLQLVSKPIGELAQQFEQQLPDGPEKSAGMRKLLEAKDCFVRAALDAPKPAAEQTWDFEAFVQYGRDHGGNIVSGMPWSFSFHGSPVTHENDDCYLIGVNDGQIRFDRGQLLVKAADGKLTTRPA